MQNVVGAPDEKHFSAGNTANMYLTDTNCIKLSHDLKETKLYFVLLLCRLFQMGVTTKANDTSTLVGALCLGMSVIK